MLRILRSLRKKRKMLILRNFATNHFTYLIFTSPIIFGSIEVLGTQKSTKMSQMSQNEPKSTILPPMKFAVRTQHFSHTPLQATAFFYIEIRQGPLPKFQVDLESVASPWGSSQLG